MAEETTVTTGSTTKVEVTKVEVAKPVMPKEIDWNAEIDKQNGVIVTADKKEYVLLKELQRLANKKGITSQVVKNLVVDFPSKCAACVVEVQFNDGTIFDGAADCTPNNSDDNFGLFAVAMAESRALARALRFGLKINMCAFEEVSNRMLKAAGIDRDKPIEDQQVTVIEQLCKRKKLDLSELLQNGSRKVATLKELTAKEGADLIVALNNGTVEKLFKK